MNVKRINDWAFDDRLTAARRPLVTLFAWFGLNRYDVLRQEFRELAAAYSEVDFCEIDLLENPSISKRYSIAAVPTTIVFVAGAERARHHGPLFERSVESVLGPTREKEE